MLKKYLIPGILIAGCAIAFILFSLLVFITKGKSPKVLKQKLLLGVLLIGLTGALASCQLDISAAVAIVTPGPKKTPPVTCYIAPPPTAKPTLAPTPMCYMPPLPTIKPTATPTRVQTPSCYTPIPSRTPTPPAVTPTCYTPVPPANFSTTDVAFIKIPIPTCYLALSPRVAPANNAEQAKAALTPPLCYAPVRLG